MFNCGPAICQHMRGTRSLRIFRPAQALKLSGLVATVEILCAI